jgi:hypothetical protein
LAISSKSIEIPCLKLNERKKNNWKFLENQIKFIFFFFFKNLKRERERIEEEGGRKKEGKEEHNNEKFH